MQCENIFRYKTVNGKNYLKTNLKKLKNYSYKTFISDEVHKTHVKLQP